MSEYLRSDVGGSAADHEDRLSNFHRKAKVRQLQCDVAILVPVDLSA